MNTWAADPDLAAVSPNRVFAGSTVTDIKLTGTNFEQGEISAPPEAVTFNGHKYLLITTPMNWSAAKTHCESLGGHLVTISSAAEQAFVYALAGGPCWIGLNDLAVENTFVWVTGEPITYLNWYTGEPNNANGNEDCVELGGSGFWNDNAQTVNHTFICEFETQDLPAVKIKLGVTEINASAVRFISSTELRADFNLTTAALGAWDVIVTNPLGGNSDTLSGGLTIAAQPFTNSVALIAMAGPAELAWGDWDNDGDLDLASQGNQFGGNGGIRSHFYLNNGGSAFAEQTPVQYFAYEDGMLDWGDFNGDGKLDLAQSGWSGTGTGTRIYRNDGGTLTFYDQGLRNMKQGDGRWADFDNDGDLDLLVVGESFDANPGNYAQIYRNTAGTFTLWQSFTGLRLATVAVADYDNDGDLDFVAGGEGGTRLYRNDGGNFAALTPFPSMIWTYFAWGDYDNDGDLDLAFCGESSSVKLTQVYRNTGGNFTLAHSFTGIYAGSVAWGDFNNDGYLDLAVQGASATGGFCRLFCNNGGTSFTDCGVVLPATTNGEWCWADYDNDGKLDFALISTETAAIYRNVQTIPVNSPPVTPTGLAALGHGQGANFRWNAATDAETPAAGLSYNLRVGTAPGKDDIFSGAADLATGYRKIVALGNAQKRTNWTLNLPNGTYYWSVQAIDTSFAGSAWALEQTAVVDGSFQPVMAVAPAVLELGFKEGDTTPKTVPLILSNSTGTGSFAWTAAENAGWLSLAPATGNVAGTGTSQIDITIDPAGMIRANSPYSATITIDAPDAFNGQLTIPVIVRIYSLVAHWKLDETTGGLAADSSGNNYNGSVNGGAWTTGILNNGLQVDGSDDFVNCGMAPSIVGTIPFTLAAWVKTTDTFGTIIQQRAPGAGGFNGEYILAIEDTVRFMTFGDSEYGFDFKSVTPVSDGQWHHVAAVREADGTGKIYIDGRLDAVRTGVLRPLIPITVYIGADKRDNSKFLAAVLDDIRIYDGPVPIADLIATFPQLPPIACNDRYDIAVNKTLTIGGTGVLSNDVDPNDDAMTAELFNPPPAGLTFSSNGTFDFVAPSTPGFVTFTYRAKDSAYSNLATVTIRVGPAPTVQAINPVRGVENRTLTGVTLTGTNFQPTAPAGAVTFNGHHYIVVTQLLSWAQAKTHCESLGGHLATIDSQDENAFINSLAAGQTVWIGLSDDVVEGTYSWVTGEPATYQNWAPGAPSGSALDDYVELSTTGKWTSVTALVTRRFICEFDGGTPSITLTKAGSPTITAADIVATATQAAFTLNLTDADLGDYDVNFTNTDQGTATLTAGFNVAPPPALSTVDPTSGDQGATPALTLTGTNLPPFVGPGSAGAGSAVMIRLKKSATLIYPTGTFTVTATTITASFNLTGAPAGLYDLELMEAGAVTATLSQGFTVVIPPGLQVTAGETEPLRFQAAQGGANPADKLLEVTNIGTGTLNWSASSNAAWLTCSPASGNTTTETDTITLSVNTAGLSSDSSPFTATVTVNAAGAQFAPKTIAVKLFLTSSDGLVAHWTLNEGSGTVANDISGGENHGTLLNGPTWTTGKIAGGLSFDGDNDQVTTEFQTLVPRVTVALWVKSPAAPVNTSSSGPFYFSKNLQINWNHLEANYAGAAAVRCNGSWYAAGFGSLKGNTWYHLAATYDGEDLRAYCNGQLVGINSAPTGDPENPTFPLTLGRNAQTGKFFTGQIDDVRVYDRVLSDAEIALLGGGTVCDIVRNTLDGEFSGTFNSGNGTPGGDFEANFGIATTKLQITDVSIEENEHFVTAPAELNIKFNKPLDPFSFNNNTIRFRRAGADGSLGSADDVLYVPLPLSTPAADEIRLTLTGLTMPMDRYRLELNGTPRGNSLLFNGNQLVSLPQGLTSAGQQMTITAWFNTNANGVIFGHQNQSYPSVPTVFAPAIYVDTDGKLRAQLANTTGINPLVSTAAVNDGKWHQVAIVVSGATQTAYLDGTQLGMRLGTVNTILMHNQLGTGYTAGWPMAPSGWFPFNGRIDEVTFWSSALTLDQLTNLRFQKRNEPHSNLSANYTFDEGSGQVAVDHSGYGTHGTLGLTSSIAADDPSWSANCAPLLNAVTDANGNPLDGDANGAAGGDFVLNFTVHPLLFANDGTLTVLEDTPTGGFFSGGGGLGALVYSIVSPPLKGTVSISPTSNAFVYTPHPNATLLDSFEFKVSNGTFVSNVATITVNITPVNDRPVILSPLSAAPNPAKIGGAVSFTVGAADADDAELMYNWTFGDGTAGSGTAVQHAFTKAGAYIVRVTIEDAQGGSTNASITILVVDPGGGGGGDGDGNEGGGGGNNGPSNPNDADNDGVTDADELALGTNQNDADSPLMLPLAGARISATLKFNATGKDSVSFAATFPNLESFEPQGAPFDLFLGGVHTAFVLDGKGRAKTANGTVALKLKLVRGPDGKKTVAPGNVPFTVKLKQGTWSDDWSFLGVDPYTNATGELLEIMGVVRLQETYYRATMNASYTAKALKGAKFRN